MAITLNSNTQELIESRMKELGFESADEFVQILVGAFHPLEELDLDHMDPQLRAAIEHADLQPDIPMEEAELRILNRVPK